jgi:hypothetical protein
MKVGRRERMDVSANQIRSQSQVADELSACSTLHSLVTVRDRADGVLLDEGAESCVRTPGLSLHFSSCLVAFLTFACRLRCVALNELREDEATATAVCGRVSGQRGMGTVRQLFLAARSTRLSATFFFTWGRCGHSTPQAEQHHGPCQSSCALDRRVHKTAETRIDRDQLTQSAAGWGGQQ